MNAGDDFAALVRSVRACTLCAGLPLGPKPIVQLSRRAKILIAGQAPGRITHHKGIPFDDPSGIRLRKWMGITNDQFYDAGKIAILPMSFCFPGTGKSGDLPPRPECAPAWRENILSQMPDIELTLVIGKYAIDWHIPGDKKMSLAQSVKSGTGRSAGLFPMPHPSPRNNRWLKVNPWFEAYTIPLLQTRIRALMA